jgi:DNA-directed RNA polymerase subunit RPC12/RpoP
MAQPYACAECGKEPPTTNTSYTLIGSQHKWRISREKQPDGTFLAKWRCPECWKAFKATQKSAT